MYRGGKLLMSMLAVMMASSLLLAAMCFVAPQFSIAEWYCYNQQWTTIGSLYCAIPCGILAGMHPYTTIVHTQRWCCNAYTCWKDGPETTSPGPMGCAFC